MDNLATILGRHSRIALQFSGGRDSLACLYLLQPFWDRLTVYWCNTGAAYPETVDQMGRVRAMVPQFVEIAGRQPAVIAQYGLPSDIMPASRTPLGLMVSGTPADMIQDRYSCCARAMMEPTLERMVEDGITLVIRGQRNADALKSPIRSGHVENGVEYLFPIEQWSTQQVMDYLMEQGVALPRFYRQMDSMPDCMTCSAWWETGASAYLKQHHTAHYHEVQRRLGIIGEAIGGHIAHFNQEVK